MNDDLEWDLTALARRDAAEVDWNRWMARLDRRLRPPVWRPLAAAAAAAVVAFAAFGSWSPRRSAESPVPPSLRPPYKGVRAARTTVRDLPDERLLATATLAARREIRSRLAEGIRRASLLQALASAPRREWVSAVVDLWPSLAFEERAVAREYLSSEPERAAAELSRRLASASGGEAEAWIGLARSLRAPSLIPALAVHLGRQGSRRAAVEALAEIGGPAATRLLVTALREREVREEALDALARQRSREAFEAIFQDCLGRASAERLSGFPAEWTIPPLLGLLENPGVRHHAHKLLVALTGETLPANSNLWRDWWSRHFEEAS